jgi:hypothetical protein
MTPTSEFAEFEAEPVPAPMSEMGRLVGVFFSPGQAFKDIAARPRWYVPVILGMIVTTTFLYLFSQHVGWEQFMRQQMAQSTQAQAMDAAQRAQVEAVQMRIAPYITWGSGAIGPIIVAVVIAGVLTFLANVVMGAGIAFKQVLAVVTYGTLPNLLRTGLAILVMYLKPPDEFDLQNPLMVNAGAFLATDAALWMKRLGASFDLFTFWTMFLMAIGLAAAAKRLSVGKAFGMILFPWALIVILSVGAAAAFSR